MDVDNPNLRQCASPNVLGGVDSWHKSFWHDYAIPIMTIVILADSVVVNGVRSDDCVAKFAAMNNEKNQDWRVASK